MNRLLSSALAICLCVLTSCATWHYKQNEDKTFTLGRSGNALSLAEGSVRVQFEVPPGWKIISALDEPLDWDYAVDAPSGKIGFGVMLSKEAHPMTTLERYQAYLANVWKLYDPKVRMERAASVTLKDGRSIPAYRYTSTYWGERIVVIIPAGSYATTFEFSNPDAKSIAGHQGEIQQIVGSYTVQKK